MRSANRVILSLIFLISCFLLAAACTKQSRPEPVPEVVPGILQGYLADDERVDALAWLAAPPAPGSQALELDEEINRRNVSMRGTLRWQQAIVDTAFRFPAAANTFSCVLDATITEEKVPYLYRVLNRIIADSGGPTSAVKEFYERPRPYVINEEPDCYPEGEEGTSPFRSYPSGHSAIGWAWALILAEIDPEDADAILARGRSFGESRMVCNVHWHSDVIAGWAIAEAAVARLHTDETFLADLAAAKNEFRAIRGSGPSAEVDCAAEAEALGM